MSRAYSIETLREPSELERLRPAWEELEAADPVAAPGTFDFVFSWATTRLKDELNVVALRRGSEIVALGPFVRAERTLGPVKVPVLQYVTRNGFVPGVRALFRPEEARESARALVEHLTDAQRTWSFLQLNNLRPGTELYRALVAKGDESGRPPRFGETQHAVAIELPDSWEEVRSQWNSNRRRTMGSRFARLEKRHETDFEEIREPADVARGLEEAFDVAAKSWQGAQSSSIASTLESRSFYRRLCSSFAKRDRLSLSILRADGAPVSFHLAVCDERSLYSLKWGYDPDFKAHGVGIIAIGEAIRAAHERGLREVEFFHPASEAKLAWGAEAREHVSLRLATDAVSARVLHRIDALRDLGG